MDYIMEQQSRPRRNDLIEPIRSLAQSNSVISEGTLVWGKLEEYPWWPGLVVDHRDVRWPVKEKDSHCILWLGPNKTASWVAADKLADFLDPNLSRLIYWLNGDDYEEAICEAMRGLLSEQKVDGNTSAHKLKAIAVQTLNQRNRINGRKQVVMDKASAWYKETLKSLENSNKSLKIIVYEYIEPSPLASTSSSQRRASVVRPSGASKRPSLSSSSTPNQITPKDQDIVVIREEEASPPRKKSAPSLPLAQSNQTGNGAVPERLVSKCQLDDKAKASPAPSRNVARKHTHSIMRTAHLKRASAPEEAPKSLPVPGSSGVKKGSSNEAANPFHKQHTSSKTILVSSSSSSAAITKAALK